MGILQQVRRSWNAFLSYEQSYGKEAYNQGPASYGPSPPQKNQLRLYNDKSIVTSIYTRIAIDVASIAIKHVQLDDSGRYSKDMDSGLNNCLTLEPNIDQGPRDFRQDLVLTLFDKGVLAIVPVDTIIAPDSDTVVDILTLRVGEITGWQPEHVKVSLWNDKTQAKEEINLEKRSVAVVYNPLYSVMNAPNSTLTRLTRKLQILDIVDEQSGSGKLDIIIQLPYMIKSEAMRQRAEQRRKDIEFQLKDSQYGIAYAEATDKIIQLNRPAENHLLKQVEYLTALLYSQLGITASVMDGTADEATMLNYYNRTVEPILDAVVEAEDRSFLGLVGIRKGQKIRYFRNPFRFVPMTTFADIADKFSRNEIMSPNELRDVIGLPPSKDPKADKLINSNMPQPPPVAPGPSFDDMDSVMNEVFDGLSADVDKLGAG